MSSRCVLVQTEISPLTWFLDVDPTVSLSPRLNRVEGRTSESLQLCCLDQWFGETAVKPFFIVITHQVNRAEENTILV